MQTVNKRLDPKKMLQTMQDFQKENLKIGMTEDMSKFFDMPDTHSSLVLWFSTDGSVKGKEIMLNDILTMCYILSCIVFFNFT